MHATAHSPCAPCGLRQEVADVPSSTRTDLSTIPIAQLAALTVGDEPIQPPYATADLATVLVLDQARAAAMHGLLTLPQLAEEALASVGWFATYCLVGSPVAVLADWLALIAAQPTRLYDA